MVAQTQEPSRREGELWLPMVEQRDAVRELDPYGHADDDRPAQAARAGGSTRLVVVLAVPLGLLQLAWIGFLGYLALSLVS